MPISLQHRRVGDITIVTCAGRIVEGAESVALQSRLDELLEDVPLLVLHLGAVDFLDSSGLGLLVRYVTRAQNAQGSLKFCALSPKIVEVLAITHLLPIFESYESEADAISAFFRRGAGGGATTRLRTDVLCVDGSADVQAYVRGLLAQAGFGVLTAGNLPDGLILLQATAPKVVIMDAAFRETTGTRAAEKFNALADTHTVIVLSADFSRQDAGEAGQRLLDQVRAIIPTRSALA
jgi:anti-sigma B factor antagonist